MYLLYRETEKLEFINSVSKSYKDMYLGIFQVSFKIESLKQKDLYEFEMSEIEELMGKLKSRTKNTASIRYFLVFQYINHFKHLRIDRDNPLFKVGPKWHERFVMSERKLISEDELDEIFTKIINAQDKALFRLIFEGVRGVKNSELLNLKVADIDFETGKLSLNDDLKGKRAIYVSNKCIGLISDAIEQREYQEGNRRKLQELIDSEYVIRRIKRKSKEGEGRDQHLIIRKIDNILKKVTKNKDMTAKVLEYSGMARKAVDISKKYNLPLNKLLHGEHFKELAQQFNLRSYPSDGYDYYAAIGKHIGENDFEIVRELYGEFEEYKFDNFILVEDNNIEHEKYKRKRRIDTPKYRNLTISAYNKCAVTGETFLGVLEACHIQPYINEKSNHIQNSILLRVDIHELYDSGYISIDENYKIKVSPFLNSEYYQSYNGKKIYLPNNPSYYPSMDALKYNTLIFKE